MGSEMCIRDRDLSLGERQRLGAALIALGEPRLVLLDEPLNGVDGHTAEIFRSLIRDWARTGAVMLVSHVFVGLEDLVNRVIVLDEGRIVVDRPVDDASGLDAAVRAFSRVEQLHVATEGGTR